KDPSQIEQYLNYADRGKIADWAKKDISLATRENLVVKTKDKLFKPQITMTRGEAAVILKKLFDRIG
ncbi:MAG: S-layer homology domain-containing protein, partial [Cellulosilyticaceae bacterium]